MRLCVTDLAIRLQNDLAWQKTPEPISHDQYCDIIIQAIKRLFVDTGRALLYDENKYIIIDGKKYYDYIFEIDEEAYVLLCAKIGFFQKVQTDVNNIVGYTTDALTVTNADKPYSHLQNSIEENEKLRRELFYRMVRFTLGD